MPSDTASFTRSLIRSKMCLVSLTAIHGESVVDGPTNHIRSPPSARNSHDGIGNLDYLFLSDRASRVAPPAPVCGMAFHGNRVQSRPDFAVLIRASRTSGDDEREVMLLMQRVEESVVGVGERVVATTADDDAAHITPSNNPAPRS